MNCLYLDLQSGISGDMFVAALLDLGADKKVVEKVLDSINLDGFSINISRVNKANLDMCDFKVKLKIDNHDSDMEYLFPKHHEHDDHHHDLHDGHDHHEHHRHDEHHFHDHLHEHEHHHEHSHDHHHLHRNLEDVITIINKSCASEKAKTLAVKIFTIIAKAEAKAHGK
uniref:nickel insertion protein n=1 Tax=Succinatimonas hippei TaxID=626938 RepID=UPI0026EF6441